MSNIKKPIIRICPGKTTFTQGRDKGTGQAGIPAEGLPQRVAAG